MRSTSMRKPSRGLGDPPPLEVAVAIIHQDGKVLIAQRLPGDSFGGYWEFPGGKVNTGEEMQAALEREIREELGIRIEVGMERMVLEHRYPSRTIRLHCFDCRVAEGQPRSMESVEWRWVLPGELNQFDFPPASRTLIAALQGPQG